MEYYERWISTYPDHQLKYSYWLEDQLTSLREVAGNLLESVTPIGPNQVTTVGFDELEALRKTLEGVGDEQ